MGFVLLRVIVNLFYQFFDLILNFLNFFIFLKFFLKILIHLNLLMIVHFTIYSEVIMFYRKYQTEIKISLHFPLHFFSL
jgi:hypothetical protein